MFPTINIGSFVFPTAGLVIILGAWFCLSLVEQAAKQLDLRADAVYGLGATAVFTGVTGARLTFVFQFWPAFQENPLSIVWPLTSGYNVWGGLFFGLAGAFFYGRAKRLPPAATLDALAPGLLLGFIVVSLADFLGGPGYGTLTSLPWGVSQFGVRRHPVQIYEILAGTAALGLWVWLRPRRAYAGQLFLASLTLYAAGRLFVDAFRANAWLNSSGLHVLQIISLLAVITGLFIMGLRSEQTTEQQSE